MRSAVFAGFLLASAALLATGTTYSQTRRRVVVLPPPVPARAAASVPAPAPAQKPVLEPPKPSSSVTIRDGLLSVELVDADLGNVMNEIAAKMGFKIEINGGVFNKKVSTKFAGLDVARGIERLLSLAQEGNYLIHYNAEGKISEMQLYAPAPVSAIQPGMQNPAIQPYRQRYRRYVPPQPMQGRRIVPGQP